MGGFFMARKLLVLLLLLLFATAPVAHTQENTGGEAEEAYSSILDREKITLADLLRLAELANPTLAAAESRVQAKAGRARPVRGAMCGNDSRFISDAQAVERISSTLHGVPVRLGTHDDAYKHLFSHDQCPLL